MKHWLWLFLIFSMFAIYESNFGLSAEVNPNADVWCYEATELCYDLYGGGIVAQSRSASKNGETFEAFALTDKIENPIVKNGDITEKSDYYNISSIVSVEQ